MAFDLPLRDNGAGTFDLTLAAGGAATNAPAENITGTGTANNAAVSISVSPAEAAGTGAANTAAVSIGAVAAEATGTGAADNATVTTGSNTNAPADNAPGTGTAYDAATSVAPAATGATGAGTAGDGAISIKVNADAALGTGSAELPDVAVSNIVTGGNAGNNASPSVTLSASIQAGQAVVVMLMQNNTDVLTLVPAELYPLDAVTPATGTGATNLWVFIADATTAGSTLSWTLSGTRNWAITYIALSDVEQDILGTVNVVESAADTVTATTTFTTPSATSSVIGYVIEFFGAKADGTALTGITAPSGYAEKYEQLASTGTFGSNVAVAVRNGNPSAAGTYGGDTWTVSSNLTTTFRYTLVLREAEGTTAATGAGEANDAAVSISVYPAEAAGTGVAHFDTAGTSSSVTLIADNPIFGFGEAFDATVSTVVGTSAPAGNAAGTGQADNAGVSITAPAGSSTGAGAAFDAGVSISVAPGAATGTGAAGDASTGVTFTAGSAAGTGAASDAVAAVYVNAEPALGTGATDDASAFGATDGTANPTAGFGTGTAFNGAVSIGVSAGYAEGTGSTYDVTVTTTANVVVPDLTGTGVASDASVTVAAAAGAGAGAGAAQDALVAVTVAPASLTGSGTAYDPVVATTFPTGGAAGTGVAGNAVVSITVYPGTAYGTGAAYELTPNPGSRGSVHGKGRPPRPTVASGARPGGVGPGRRGAPGVGAGTRGGPRVDGSGRVASTTEGGTP